MFKRASITDLAKQLSLSVCMIDKNLMKNPPLKLLALALVCCSRLGAAPVVSYHFDTPEEVAALKNPKVAWVAEPKVAGAGAAVIHAENTAGAGCSITLPKDSPEGVLTWWIYDPIFESGKGTSGVRCSFSGTIEKDSKQISKGYWFADHGGNTFGGWLFGSEAIGLNSRETSVPRHAGWTRFDVVKPPGVEPLPLIVYVDGHEVCRTPEKFLSLSSLSISVGGMTYCNVSIPLYIDEIRYDDSAASFRPNVIQALAPSWTTLKAGDKLPVQIMLAPKGARANEGEITMKLYDGAERELCQATSSVDWTKQDDKPLTVELPAPPRSGWFWVEASYKDKSLPVPDVVRSRVDVQYLTPGFEHPTREKVVFDTPWDFLPAPSAKESAPPADWTGAQLLSGPWQRARNYCLWQCVVPDVTAAWYRRTVEVPANWSGRRILLDVYDPKGDIQVFANGKKVTGEIRWPGAALDLTAFAKPGKRLDLALLVAPVAPDEDVSRGLSGELTEPRGLSGEVSLRCEPLGPGIENVAVRTYIEEGKRLWAQFDCVGLTPGKTYKIEAAASAAGQIDNALPPVTFTAKAATQGVVAEAPWDNPTLWDVGKPFLYSLNAKLEDAGGKALDTLWPQRFGFRELKTKGHLMTLNGQPLSLFNRGFFDETMTRNFGVCDWMRRMNYNSAYRTDGFQSVLDPKFFDEAGIARRMYASDGWMGRPANQKLIQEGKEMSPEYWAAKTKEVEYFMKRFRNCPSVLQWCSASIGATDDYEMNPLLQDGLWLPTPTDDLERRTVAWAMRYYNLIRSLDPTRYQDDMCTHNYNDTINYHFYCGFEPMQEIIERNEHWIQYGVKPLFLDETVSPFINDWTNSPWEGGGGHASPRKVSQVAEWCAVTKGDASFVRDANEDAGLKSFEKTALAGFDEVDKIADPQKRAVAQRIRSLQKAGTGYPLVCASDPTSLRNQVWIERGRENMLNWRADGVAGITSWFDPAVDTALRPVCFDPVVGFLAGTPEKRTTKDHIFAPGETLRRSVLALNNGRDPAKVACSWKLTLGGKTVADGKESFSVAGGGQFSLPIEVVIPPGGDRQGELSMKLSADGKELSSDSCRIDVLTPRPCKVSKPFALVDPEGDSATALKKIGAGFQLVPFASDLAAYDTIVFGRRAFDYELQFLPEGIDLGALLALGKNILILEQSEKTLRERFKLRTEYVSPRDTYARLANSPLFDGLPDACLKYWRGASTLTSGYEVALQNLKPGVGCGSCAAYYLYTGNDSKSKKRFIKWGNTHNVATVVIIKPDTGNFRTLVDCEFALNYAAALELRNGRGNLVFNQLDVTGRTLPDPASERYLSNLLSFTEAQKPAAWRQAVYLGGDAGAKLLESLRIDFKRIKDLAEARPADALILGGDASPEGLDGFAQAGGMVFCLPRDKFSCLPFAVEAKPRPVNHSVLGKAAADPLLQGLGNTDFYWKGDVTINALEKVEGAALLLDSGVLARVPRGKGEFVLCQIEPGMFDANKRFWLERSKRFNERTLVNLLSNCGVEMAAPYFLRPPKAKDELVATVDLAGDWETCPGLPTQEARPADGPAWRKLALPGKAGGDRGMVWYRRSFHLKELPAGANAKLLVGLIRGCDITLINGTKVGQTDMSNQPTDASMTTRRYALPAGLLKVGRNEIAIRVEFDKGGALGMRDSDGSVNAPMTLSFFRPAGDLAAAREPFSLEGKWQGCAIGKTEAPCPPATDPRWHDLTVPGNYQPQHADWKKSNGFFWYRKSFTLPAALPAGAEPFLLMGGVDDWDTTWLNGTKIGHTGPDNFFAKPSAYDTPRTYAIPPDLLKAGENEITLLDDDPINDGGIRFGPVQLIFADPEKVAKRLMLASNYLNMVAVEDDPYVARHW